MSEKLAHVSYILSEEEQTEYRGADYAFLSQPFTEPVNWLAVSASVAIFILAITAARRTQYLRDRVRYFRGRARTYAEYISLILRLSLGVAFIGAGSQQALLSPAVHNQPGFAVLQLIIGVLLICGFLLTPTLIAALALAIGAFILHPTLFDNLEIIGCLIAILMLAQAKPGFDDLMGIPNLGLPEQYRSYVPLVLRLSLGLSLLVMAIGDKLLNPHWFAEVIERYGLVAALPFSTGTWVASATIIESFLGLAILLGFQTRIASAITFLVLGIFFVIFGEEVYAHVTLFGALFVLLITGSGNFSVDHTYARHRQ